MSGIKVTRENPATPLPTSLEAPGDVSGEDVDWTTGPDTPLPLDGLSDVDAPTPGDGDVLTWDDGTDTWIAAPASGGTTLPWYDVTDYGATGDGTTDDTVAVQDAIDACDAGGGGTVYFPPGIYQISGALQATGVHNSQLVIPTAATHRSMRFLGWAPNKIYGGTPSTGNESVIRSDWNGSISGNPAIISAGTYHGIGESVYYVTFQDLTIVAHDDPKLTALQMTACQSTRIQNVQIRTTSAVPSAVPTHSNAVGLDGPWGLASIVPDYAIGLDVYGFYTGIVPAEQFHGVDIGIAFCTRAMLFIGGPNSPTYTHYPVTMTKLVFTLCPRGLVFTTAERWVQILQMSVEHDTGIWASVYDIDDANNYAYGFIDYHVVDYAGGVGTSYDILVNNALNLSYHWGAGKFWKLNSQVQIPKGTNPSNNPPSGFTLYADSTSGHPTIRDALGATTDLLTGTGPSFATPAIVLGTAAAAGAASTVIRSDSTIVAFDATVPVTQAFSDAAATGSAAVAARRDHRHGMPASPALTAGLLLIADTHSTPLVFADLIQNEAQDDLLYSD